MSFLRYFIGAFLILGLYSCSIFEEKIDYSSQVKPIINKNCISCHGGVKKQGGYSLLFKEEAFSKGKSGRIGIVPGDASASEFIRRLTLKDPEERMPHEKEPLSDEEVKILTKWIDQGAEWEQHWAFVPVSNPEVPKINNDWLKNDIDKFIYENAERQGLKTSSLAPKEDLARRAALDVIGFPASDKTKAIFLKNNLYETYVDSLLASPAYGEKWTSMWLDMARYADTKGYERDGGRNIWRYRDWLIKAFNADMPYDQFLKEQIAGDLLPEPSENQLIATAFHRNTMTNDEGGTDNEEFRTAAVLDRVNTTWETLMGTSFSCVQCHSHPYDPIRFEEYYKFLAFFNNSRDEDTYSEYPVLRHFDEKQRADLARVDNWLAKTFSANEKKELITFLKTLQPSHNSLKCDEMLNAALADTKWLAMRNNSSARLKSVNLEGKTKLIMNFKVYVKGVFEIKTDNLNGKTLGSYKLSPEKEKGGWRTIELPINATSRVHDLFFTFKSPELKDPNANGIMFDWFYFTKGLPDNSPENKTVFWNLLNAPVEQTPIMFENPADFSRKTRIFERGSWLSQGNEVSPAVPAVLGKLPKGAPTNRLGLALWMTSKENPLVARTMVNRVWEQIFGTGLVETLEDLGSQGAVPTNQALLDYLSYKFMNDYNWSVKKLIKEIMLSATYQQDSKLTPEGIEKDPSNRYLARGPRVRLSAEQIRDQALAISGVLNPKMYGPPVMPYQPEGIWSSPYSGDKWIKAQNENQYRRAVYTFWKRTSPYPSMISFDGVGREICVSRRIRTNTPLQALVTLNDSVYVDLSAKLAQKSLSVSKNNFQESIKKAYGFAIGKEMKKEKFDILLRLYQSTLTLYKKDPSKSKELLGNPNPELAALVLVCNSILNLDEVITKS
ncbi:DUF1553 domain-containing protein [Lacihabitans soyangensis]|uniref:DUF1553 domain-containing protein n=1 Tax=Lacihabitans soyangensis TaxID=869394 RepID=A0AAE3GZZ8_9BACT|nr:DUF1553 domain-containing protein [Lacihabitans soyangensis]MCP9761765.1 DUF1553 domain-containing protein [Lacihabitans soyangensis]